ncbi:MAG: hypothetical protein RL186_1143 [Pseudomonadota bacterium]
MTLCLITRTQPGASATAQALAVRGHTPVIVCAAQTVGVDHEMDVAGVQALLMTSAAAARHARTNAHIRALPVYAVGDATAQAALAAGFETVISAGGDGATLAVLAADQMQASDGALLHLRGQEVAGDVTGMLNACGFQTRALEVYHTWDDPDFKAGLAAAMAGDGNRISLLSSPATAGEMGAKRSEGATPSANTPSAALRTTAPPRAGEQSDHAQLSSRAGLILFHSPAGARRTRKALQEQQLNVRAWGAIGLSQACLAPLADLDFAHLGVAEQPDDASLLDAIDAFAAQNHDD